MKSIAAAGLLVTLMGGLAGSAMAGVIQGRVVIQGKTQPTHVVVYLEGVPGSFTPDGRRPELLHRNLAFYPPVLPVLKGSVVDFPNTDPVFHSAFSVSPSNPFELGIYGQGRDKFVQFNNLGIVDVSCHIHPFMRAVILVLDNPFFAVTNDSGHYTIDRVPPGRYTVRTWSADSRPTSHPVSVDRTETTVLDLRLVP
jgi:hypothetical protein